MGNIKTQTTTRNTTTPQKGNPAEAVYCRVPDKRDPILEKLLDTPPPCVKPEDIEVPPLSDPSREGQTAGEVRESIKEQEQELREDKRNVERAKELVEEYLEETPTRKQARKELEDAKKLLTLLESKGALSEEMQSELLKRIDKGLLQASKDPQKRDEILLETLKDVRALLVSYLERWETSITQSLAILYFINRQLSNVPSNEKVSTRTRQSESVSPVPALGTSSQRPDREREPTSVSAIPHTNFRAPVTIFEVDAPPPGVTGDTLAVLIAGRSRKREKERRETLLAHDQQKEKQEKTVHREMVENVRAEIRSEYGVEISIPLDEVPSCPIEQSRDSLRFELRQQALVTRGSPRNRH